MKVQKRPFNFMYMYLSGSYEGLSERETCLYYLGHVRVNTVDELMYGGERVSEKTP